VTTDTAAPSKLYEAAVGFLVSEKSNSNAWEEVAKFVYQYTMNGSSLKDLRREFAIVEKQIRKDFEVNKLPPAWRSAKSTALSALQLGVPLIDTATSTAMPKTDVGKLIKAAKAGTVTRSDMDKLRSYLEHARIVFDTLGAADQVMARDHTYILWDHMVRSLSSPVMPGVPSAAAMTVGS
jgi:hypothetical protein